MLRDAEHFKSKIGGLDGAGDAGDYIVNLVKAKAVPKPTPPAPEVVAREAPTKKGTNTDSKISDEAATNERSEVEEKGKQGEKKVDVVEDK